MLRPLRNNLLIERIPEAETSVIVNPFKPQSLRGKVLAVGEGTLTKSGKVVPSDVQIGDVIVFTPLSGERPFNEHKFMQDEPIVISEMDVVGIVDG
jgi:chaperonin GroES